MGKSLTPARGLLLSAPGARSACHDERRGKDGMTSRGLAAVLLRRWYLVLLGAVLTVAGTYATTHRPGVYWTGYEVVLLAPSERYYVNKLEDPHYELAPLAGVFVRQWNESHPGLLTASAETRLYGEGERSAVQVRMSNQGSQWKPLYPSPAIDVQVVDTSPELVAERSAETLAQIEDLLRTTQDAAGVSAAWRIVPLQSPSAPDVSYHGGSRVRAAGASGVLGVSITFAGVWWLDRRLRRRQPSTAALAPADTRAEVPSW